MAVRATGGERLALILVVALVGLVCAWPMLRLAQEALAPGGRLEATVLREVLSQGSTWNATWNSLDAALWSTLLALILGTVFALLVASTDIRGPTALVFAFVLPLMVPPQITALSWSQLAGPGSPLLGVFGIAPPPGTPNPLYSRDGIILLLGIQHAPLVFLTARAMLRRIPGQLVEAAYLMGAGPLQTLRFVVLPLLAPALIAGAALAFVSAIGNFGIAALLGIPASHTLLPVLIYRKLASFGPSVIAEVAVLSLLVGAIAYAGVVVQNWMLRRRDVAVLDAEGPPFRIRLGRWRPAVEATAWGVLVLILVLPLAALIATALVPAYGVRLGPGTATLANFAEVLLVQDATRRAFWNSTLLAAGAALVLMALAIPIGFFVAWRPGRASAFLKLAAELPYALPGVVLAVACILVFLKPLPLVGISLYGTIWIIFAAYLARFLTLALSPVVAGYHQLDRAVDEAAQLDGAGFWTRLRLVVLPLVAPTATAGAVLVFMTAFNELTVSALLWSVGAETLGVIVFNLDDGGYTVLASAVAVLCVLVIFLIMTAAQLLDRRLRVGVLPWST